MENSSWGSLYGAAFLGAAIYYLSHAANFWDGVFGLVKAIFWPGALVYELLAFFKA